MKKIWGILLVTALGLGSGAVYLLTKDSAVAVNAAPATYQYLSVEYRDDYLLNSGKEISYYSAPGAETYYNGDKPVYFDEYKNDEDDDGAGAIIGTTGRFQISFSSVQIPNNSGGDWVTAWYSEPLSVAPVDWAAVVYEPAEEVIEFNTNTWNAFSLNYTKLGIYRIEINTKNTSSETESTNVFVFVVRNLVPDDSLFDTVFTHTNSLRSFNSYASLNTVTSLDIQVTKNVSAGQFGMPAIKYGDGFTVTDNNEGSTLGQAVDWFERDSTVEGSDKLFLRLREGKKIKKGEYSLTYTISVTYTNISSDGTEETEESADIEMTASLYFSDPPPPNRNWLWALLGLAVLGVIGGGLVGLNKVIEHTQAQHENRLEGARAERRRIEQENIAKLRSEMEKEEIKPPKKKPAPKKQS